MAANAALWPEPSGVFAIVHEGDEASAAVSTLLSLARTLATDANLPPDAHRRHTRRLREKVRRARWLVAARELRGETIDRPFAPHASMRPHGTLPPASLRSSILSTVFETFDVEAMLRSASCSADAAAALRAPLETAANLLDIAVGLSASLVAEASTVCTGRIVERTLRACASPARYRRVTLLGSTHGGKVRVDEDMIVRAVVALVLHAVSAMAPGTTVDLQIEHAEGLMVELSLTGELAPPSPLSPMSGLEFAFVRSVFAAHGGGIEIDSRGGRTTVVLQTGARPVAGRVSVSNAA